MLGRLEMTVDDCIEKYKMLIEKIFGSKINLVSFGFKGDIKPKFSSSKLEEGILQVLRDLELNEKTLFNDGKERGCRV
jgi:hypothetical protein